MTPTERAFALRLARAKARAIDALLDVLDDPAATPIERRRAAAIILRTKPQDAEPSLDPLDVNEAEHEAPLSDEEDPPAEPASPSDLPCKSAALAPESEPAGQREPVAGEHRPPQVSDPPAPHGRAPP